MRISLSFIFTCGLLNITLGLLLNLCTSFVFGPSALPSALIASHARDMKDPLMLFPLLLSPFVSAASLWVFFQLFSPRGVSASATGGALLGAALWVLGAGHGVLIDAATFNLAPLVVGNFLAVTLLQGCAAGVLLSRWV